MLNLKFYDGIRANISQLHFPFNILKISELKIKLTSTDIKLNLEIKKKKKVKLRTERIKKITLERTRGEIPQ
jgi:hypothetical protein